MSEYRAGVAFCSLTHWAAYVKSKFQETNYQTDQRGGDSSVGWASNWKTWHNTDAGSSPWRGKGFFFLSQLQCRLCYSVCTAPVCNHRMHLSLVGAATSIIFVATKLLSRQTHVCHNKSFVAISILLSWQKMRFVATNTSLSRQK